MNKTLLIILLFGLIACEYCEEVVNIDKEMNTERYRASYWGMGLGTGFINFGYRRIFNNYLSFQIYVGTLGILNTAGSRVMITPKKFKKYYTPYFYGGAQVVQIGNKGAIGGGGGGLGFDVGSRTVFSLTAGGYVYNGNFVPDVNLTVSFNISHSDNKK